MGKILIIKGADFSSVALGTLPISYPGITIIDGVVTIKLEGAKNIYYTLDGSIPTKNSTKYTEPFTVEDRTTVKAIAEFSNGTFSSVYSLTYYAGNHRYITVVAEPTNGGTVSGTGAYQYGAKVTIHATPNSGYEFKQWNDGVTTNPRMIRVEADETYTAIFELQTGRINVSVTPEEGGTVSGAGEYPIGTEVTLVATPNDGYVFECWNLSNTTVKEPTLKVSVTEEDKNINAVFVPEGTVNKVTITAQAEPEDGGTFTGTGTYQIGEEVTLTAIPNPGYAFNYWMTGSSITGDENDYNPTQVFTISKDITRENQALFSTVKTTYTADELLLDSSPGYINGLPTESGLLPGDTTVEAYAGHALIPVEGFNRIRLKGTYPGCILACYNKAYESSNNCIKVYLNNDNEIDDPLAPRYYDNLELELPSGTSWVGINWPVLADNEDGTSPDNDQEVILFNV